MEKTGIEDELVNFNKRAHNRFLNDADLKILATKILVFELVVEYVSIIW